MKIGLIGDHISDVYIYGDMTRFSPESPIPIFDMVKEEHRPGGASNVFANLRSMDADVNYYTNSVKFSTKRRFVCGGHILFRVDHEEYTISEQTEYVFDDDVKTVILSDYNKGVLHHSKEIVNNLKKAGMFVIVDGKKPISSYEGADIIKMNESEYDVYNEPTDSTLVVTMGARGVKIIKGLITTEIPGNEVAVSDVTGAGDVFLAAMAVFLEQGNNINKACEKANYLAALSVTKFGTYAVTQEDIRKADKKVVFTNGCFDIIHPGHVKYLQESKRLGDKLIVGLNSDRSVKALKGDSRPIHDEQSRKKVLESLECVDEVIIFDEDTPYELIKMISPDLITKGSDYTSKEQVVGHDLADVALIDYDEKYSTTKILEFKNENG